MVNKTQSSNPPLVERIASYSVHTNPKYIPATKDKWLLASNLQKSIRRGLAQTAVGTATRLLEINPSYFWRRLLVIAYEDIGYGDINLCHDLLKTFRRESLHQQLGPERVAGYFTHQMAESKKSRALCNGIAIMDFSIQRGEYERTCFDLSDEQLITTACDISIPIMNRVAALRHICGYHDFAHGTYRVLVPAKTELMREIVNRLELTEMETKLFLSGQSVSETMNIVLPIVSLMVRGASQQEQRADFEFSGKSGILFAAIDKHTRVGKQCITRFAREVKAIKQFFGRHPVKNPVAALGACVFIVEGMKLNHWVVFDGEEQINQMLVRNFLEYSGVDSSDQLELLKLVEDNLNQLNQIRAEEMG